MARRAIRTLLAGSKTDWLYRALLLLTVAVFCVRLFALDADFTSDKSYTRDGVLYTDEGWYSANAWAYSRLGQWHRPHDLNFAVNLPVLQILHGFSFALFGANIIGARMTIVFSAAVLFGLVYFVIRRWEGRWAALLALAWLALNYFFYLYSRIALAEFPMAALAMGGLVLASVKWKRRGASAVAATLSGVFVALAVYTKTSGLFAVPLLAVVVLWPSAGGSRGWRIVRLALALGGMGLVAGLHWVLLARPYREDFEYFHTLNLAINANSNPLHIVQFALEMMDRMQLIDKVIWRLLVYSIPPLVIFDRTFRKHPLVLISLLWIVIYIGMFAYYANMRPRYWVPLCVPMSVLLALAMRAFWRWQRRSHWGLGAFLLLCLAVAGSFLRNAGEIVEYLEDRDFSFKEMAADFRSRILAEDPERRFLIGHFASTIALYEPELVPFNDRFAPVDLSTRLEAYRPRFLVTESSIYLRDYADQARTVHPDAGGQRLRALQEHTSAITPVAAYEVFDNYQGWPVTLYRLDYTE